MSRFGLGQPLTQTATEAADMSSTFEFGPNTPLVSMLALQPRRRGPTPLFAPGFVCHIGIRSLGGAIEVPR